jgi:hypothetical protein
VVVRVPVELKSGEMTLRTAALANSGYEAEEPEVHIPIALARKLGFKLEGIRGERYGVVGAEVTAYILGEVMLRAKTEDRESNWIRARAVTVPGEYEVILSDSLMEEMGIEILKPSSGLWRFSGESGVRESEKASYWPD